jgi:peptide deformylase
MTIKSGIIQNPHSALRAKNMAVDKNSITSPRIQQIITRMKQSLDKQEDGVAIACPQIGENLRIFIVSPKAFLNEDDYKQEEGNNIIRDNSVIQKQISDKLSNILQTEKLVFINPTIIKKSKETKIVQEGCLSVRWLYGDVSRHTRATVRAYDEQGILFSRGASGLLAQIFQHEIDHLNGILFIDKAQNIHELPPEKRH